MSTYYGGWAMMLDFREQQKKIEDAARRVNWERDIDYLTKSPGYGRIRFEGKLKEGSTVTEDELLAFVDHGNLCFGGDCTINGLDFIGTINTD